MSIIIVIWILYRICKAANKRPYPKQAYVIPNQINYRNQEKLIKEREKQIRQQQKQIAQAEKERLQRLQAEKDIEFYTTQYETLYDLARQIESDIQDISKAIENDLKMRLYDKAKTKEKELFRLTKKQISIESQLYSMQSKINKAEYIINRVA